ncbi:hypothetical protein IV203_037360 [Nitzschia inconspicua]|uniref:Uncharacterized protein n=1 Tax=Nitzschia inconspicua TaxID=303405 RepID=A0A9K3LM11_9STRA|nr:hypothetical protein IV203_007640 [Nitzschia inconspicua]KAG7364158.1 hypothetical protein IV203_037360 [Nitzschia inconspicua]
MSLRFTSFVPTKRRWTTRPCGLIFRIESSNFGCSCSYHECRGTLVVYNAVVRFEKRVVETRENQYASIGAAPLVLDGIDQCLVGRLGSMYDNVLNHLDGRLAQVTEKFSDSTSQHNFDYNTTNNGVCSAIIIDRYVLGDGVMNALLDGVNLDSSDEEV